MVFVGKKQPKFPGVTKTFEKDICKTTYNFTKFNKVYFE